MTQDGANKNTADQNKPAQSDGSSKRPSNADAQKPEQAGNSVPPKSTQSAVPPKGAVPPRAKHSSPTKPQTTIDLKAAESKVKESKTSDAKADKEAAPKISGQIPANLASAASKAAAAKTDKSTADKPSNKPNEAGAPKPTVEADAKSAAKAEDNKSGFGGKLVAGLCGGAIALGGWAGLQNSGILPMNAQPAGIQTSDLTDALNSREAKFEEKLADLQAQIKTASKASSSPDLKVIDGKFAAIEKKLAEISKTAGNTADPKTAASLSDINGKIKSLSDQLSGLKTPDMAPLTTKLEALENQVVLTQNKLAEANEANKALVARIDALEKTLQDEGPEQKAAKVLAASALQSQIASGKDYAESLKSYKQITGDETSFKALEAFAERGIPTPSQLQQQFAEVSDAVLAALEPKVEEGDMIGKLFSSAKSLIKVKPVEGKEGSEPIAVLGRIQSHLKKGNLDGVLSEWQILPEAGQKAGQEWIKAVEMRQTANGILDTVLHKMMTN